VRNTHPFLQDNLFAHNGVVTGLDVLEERLVELSVMDLVLGATDSERAFALITGCVRAMDGDVEAALVDAMTWLAENVPIYAANLLLATATDVWALRFPDTHELYMLDRRVCSTDFDMQTDRIHATSRTWIAGSRWCSPLSRWTTIRHGDCWRRACWYTLTPHCRSHNATRCPTPRNIG
jgi:predicted glutamine amidotransferase